MKKTMIFAAVAAMFVFASCQKEEPVPGQNVQSEELVFTATIDQSATKTTINTDASSANKGKVSWEVNDEISVTDDTNTAVYYIKEASDIAADGSATFTYKSGDRPSSTASSYTASYGDAITAAQTYSTTVGKLPMKGVSDNGDKTKLNFSVSCGLLKLNLTASGENTKDISKIEIVGTPTGGSAAVYTLTCDNESIASAKDFYIALPAGDYTLMKFTNSKGCVCFKKATAAMAIEANKIQPVTLSGITFSALLPGRFTVASGKQVQFTTANLWCNASASPVTYSFEAAQNVTYKTLGQKTYTADHVCHFYWSKDASVAYAQTYSDAGASIDDKFFCGEDNPMTIDGQSGLYALTGVSSGEWYYLFKTRNSASSLYKKGVSITTSAGKTACFVIAPDDYSGSIADSYDAAAWVAAESNGLVCLPTAGYRKNSDLYSSTCGYYWSASPYTSSDKAYDLFFTKSNLSLAEYMARSNASSVRLVHTAAPSAPVYPEAPTLACVKIGDTWWAPVNCGYDVTNYTYGKLYQWGRKYGQGYSDSSYSDGDYPGKSEGSQSIEDISTSGSLTSYPDGDTYNGKFYKGQENWYNGETPAQNNLWGATKTDYDPCPSGWRVPTNDELNALFGGNSSPSLTTVGDQKGAYFNGTSNPGTTGVFLPAASYRDYNGGDACDRGNLGFYWSSSVDGDRAKDLTFGSGFAYVSGSRRAFGYSVRCVKE